MRFFLVPIFFIMLSTVGNAQQKSIPVAEKLPLATLKQHEIYKFDLSRPVENFDATPNGSLWYAVDNFGLMRTMIINGNREDRRFNEIPALSTSLSPDGSYLIWVGLDRHYDTQGFNTTVSTAYKYQLVSKKSDSLLSIISDFNTVFFSPNSKHWAAIFPAANVLEKTLRDAVIVDGKIASTGQASPRKFSFSHDGNTWAFRSTNGIEEHLITSAGNQLLYQRSRENPYLPTDDPIILRFSPDVVSNLNVLDGRDYDFDVRHVATMYQTNYKATARDTSNMYLVFKGKRQLYSKWIKNIQIDSGGKHIIYFASDTSENTKKNHTDQKALVVRDGNVIAGPYDGSWRLVLSPSGEHTAWTTSTDSTVYFYLDGNKVSNVGEFFKMVWSADEKQIAYVTTEKSEQRERVFVVAGNKRSPAYDMIGRIGFTADGKAVEYIALKYNKLLNIVQPL